MQTKPDVFAAIGDPTRRQILLLLTGGAMSVSMLADNFDISRPAVSKHIKTLEQTKLISITESGRERFCALNPEGFDEVRDWLDFYEQFWKQKLKNLGDLLNKKYNDKTKKKL
jgi:DNA-binding transcriptional ArsR family regulator